MRRRSVLRASQAVAAFTIVATFVVAPVDPALARPREVVVIQEGAETVVTFDGIPANNPTSGDVNPEPSDCGEPGPPPDIGYTPSGALSATCDVVPLKILLPNVTDADDFSVVIDLEWEPKDQIEDLAAANDLDMYLYDNHQMAQREDPDSTAWTQIGSSTNATQPESLRLYRPELVDYNLVITNWVGTNVSYTIKARIVVGLFETPFEALAPTARVPAGGSDDGASEAPPIDYSAEVPVANAPVAEYLPPPAPGLSDVAVLPDSDFEGFAAESGFESALAAPATPALPASFRLPPPRAVGAPVLVFWLLLVPLALLAGAALLVRRRAPRFVG